MAIDFACGNCGKWFHLDDAMAGLQGRCSACGVVMPIPNKPVAPPRPAPTPKLRPPDPVYRPAPPPTPALRSATEMVHWPAPAPMTRRAPVSAPIPGWSSDPDPATRYDSPGSVEPATPHWFAGFLRIAGTLLVMLGIAAQIASAAGSPLLPGAEGKLIGLLGILVGVLAAAAGLFFRQLMGFWLLTGVSYRLYLACVPVIPLMMLFFYMLVGRPSRDGVPPAPAPVARQAAPQPAPVPVFAPQPAPIVAPPPVEIAVTPDVGPVPVPTPPVMPPPVVGPAGGRDPAQGTMAEHHRRVMDEMRRRHEQMREDSMRRVEQMREESRRRQEEIRSRFGPP